MTDYIIAQAVWCALFGAIVVILIWRSSRGED